MKNKKIISHGQTDKGNIWEIAQERGREYVSIYINGIWQQNADNHKEAKEDLTDMIQNGEI